MTPRPQPDFVGAPTHADYCGNCGGAGGFESAPHGYDPLDGRPLTHWIECNVCGGLGWEEAIPQDITQDDLPPPASPEDFT